MFNRAYAELLSLVYAAETTLVPGAVSRDPNKQAVGFAGRPDWP